MESRPQYFLEIDNVVKRYAGKTAVDGASLNVAEGSILGLLGPNGAGKTTLIRMITCITRPDEGRIRLRGEVLKDEHQRLIGYMPEERGLYKKMKIGEQIEYLLQLKDLSAAEARQQTDAWLARFELADWRNHKVDELSKGMQQKVQFIATIAHRPPLLILDEPFSGLDPINAILIQNVIVELAAQGVTVIFSTHRMEQVEEFCDAIALVNQGKIVLQGRIEDIRRERRQNRFQLETDETLTEAALPPEIIVRERGKHRLDVELAEGFAAKDFLAYMNQNFTVTKFQQYVPPIRDIFIETVTKGRGHEK